MLPGTTFTLDDVIRILVRRRWLILLPFALGLLLVPVIAQRVAEVYRSETLIMVVPQRVPDDYVRSTVTGTIEDRLPSISDLILSRSRLERVIEDLGLYADLRREVPMEDVVAQMRADVGQVTMRPGEQAFVVGFTSRDPVTAQRVASRLASLFLDENTRDREAQAVSTNDFLESRVDDARRRLIEQEQRLEAYRRAHAGELPAQLPANQQAIQNAQLQLTQVNESMNRAVERRYLKERELAEARRLPFVPLTAAGRPDPTSLTAAQQLALARADLESLQARLRPGHPELTAQERRVSELEQRAKVEADRPEEARVSPEEQLRQARIGDLQAELEIIDLEIRSRQADADRLNASIADYQRKIAAAPTRDAELVELTRDYEVLRRTYDDLVLKKEGSETSAELERRQIGEQFRILDAAALPERPTNEMRRYAMIFSGALGGLLLGLALTALLEFRDTTFRREADLVRLLELPVLALVPTMTTPVEQQRARRHRLAMDLGASAVLVVSAGVAAIWGLVQ